MISTHAPREGRDAVNPRAYDSVMRFQPTRPARGATVSFAGVLPVLVISTHAPREGRDVVQLHFQALGLISTHAPREGRDAGPAAGHDVVAISTHAPREGRDVDARTFTLRRLKFQPTRPARGATRRLAERIFRKAISTHAPREGRDSLP